MLPKFTDDARRALSLAEEEAGKVGKMVVSTEHILLGLFQDESTAASAALSKLGVEKPALEAEVAKLLADPVGKKPRTKVILSRDAKQAINATYEELGDLKDSVVGTEHLLLGMIKQGGAAAQVLSIFGVDLEKARQAVLGTRSISAATSD